MKSKIILNLFLIVVSLIPTAARANNPENACAQYTLDMSSELNTWTQSPVESSDSITINQLTSLRLKPQSQVQFPIKPEKTFSSDPAMFAGFFKFQVPSDGIYKISSGAKVWIDTANADAGKLVETRTFEMQPKCKSIFKVVTFELKKNTNYILQVNSSVAEKVLFLISGK